MTETNQIAPLTQWVPPVGADHVKAFIPADFPSVYRFSELIAESGMAPKDLKTPAQISVAIFMGAEVGMTPMAALRSIAVINGRPSLWGDGTLGLIRSKGLIEDIEEWYTGEWGADDYTAHCRVKRKGVEREIVATFSVSQSKRADLWLKKAGPWTQYPERMLKMRARAYALRDLFNDVLGGFYIAEEIDDDGAIDATPPAATSRDESPAGPKRTRRTTNRFADDAGEAGKAAGDAGKTIDHDDKGGRESGATAETSSTQVAEEQKPADSKPAGSGLEKPAEPEKSSTAETAKAPASTEKQADVNPPAPTKRAAAKKDKPAAEPAPVLTLGDIVPNMAKMTEDVKGRISKLHDELLKAENVDQARVAWRKYVPSEDRPWPVAFDESFEALRIHHRKRIEALPPKNVDDFDAPTERKPATADTTNDSLNDAFDFDGFVSELKEGLAACKTADDVTRVFAECTEIPLREGVVSQKEYEDVLQPIAQARLEELEKG